MNTQTNNAAAAAVTQVTVSASAASVALGLKVTTALKMTTNADSSVRAVLWLIIDAKRADEISTDEGSALIGRYVDARIAAASRGKYRQRGLAALNAAASDDEQRETRDPLNWIQALNRKADAAAAKAEKAETEKADAAAATATVRAFEAEAASLLAGDAPMTMAEGIAFMAKNAAEISALAASLAADKACGAALDAALKAAIEGGMTRERVAAFVAAAFAA